jgi:hypothetical protein
MTPIPGANAASELPQAATVVLARLHARAWGIAVGLLMAMTLAAATLALVIRGGADVGRHLSLLRVFLPGYSVSIQGVFVGFVYFFVIGYALGRLTGTLYNRLARDA